MFVPLVYTNFVDELLFVYKWSESGVYAVSVKSSMFEGVEFRQGCGLSQIIIIFYFRRHNRKVHSLS